MALLTSQTINRNGLVPTMSAATGGGDTFANTGREFVQITNGGGGTISVTFAIPYTLDGVSVAGKVVSISAGQTKLIGPFPVGTYTDPNTGNVSITYSGVTSVTIGVLILTQS